MRQSRLISLSEAPQYVTDRLGVSPETAEAILKYGFREHSLSAVSCRHDDSLGLGINLATVVDFEDADIYWNENKVRRPGGFENYENVCVHQNTLDDWITFNWKAGRLLDLIDATHPIALISTLEHGVAVPESQRMIETAAQQGALHETSAEHEDSETVCPDYRQQGFRTTKHIQAEQSAKKWFIAQVDAWEAAGRNPALRLRKQPAFDSAQKLFGKELSQRAFNERIWPFHAPEEWKKGGAPKSKPLHDFG